MTDDRRRGADRVRNILWRCVQVVATASMAVLLVGLLWPSSTPTGTISYTLDWNAEDLTSTGDGIEIVSDLGYTVTVADASVASWSTATVACEHDHNFSVWDSAAGVVESTLGATPASAGHSETDGAELVAPTIEAVVSNTELASATATDLGEVTVSEPTWCEGHWALSGRSGSEQAGGTVSDPTLVLSGTVENADGAVTRLFLSTDLAWGTKTDLTDTSGAIVEPATGDPISVVVVRDLSAMFDGIDFGEFETGEIDGTSGDESLALAVLRNLEGSTRFVVTPTSVVS